MNRKRYTVLTYIIGDYESVHEVQEKDPEAEYLLITDIPGLKADTWDVIVDDSLRGLSLFDKCYSVRFGVFKYCHTDICLRVDASVQIRRSAKCLIDAFEEGAFDVALMPHPVRYDVCDEYKVWVQTRNYPQQQADRCLNSMRNKGYDLHYRGLFQGGFVIQRRSSVTEKMNSEILNWLKELGSDGKIERLDQTIFSCVINMHYSYLKVLPVSEHLFHSDIMRICHHGTDVENPGPAYDLNKPDVKWMFGKRVVAYKFIAGEDAVDRLIRFNGDAVNASSIMLAERDREVEKELVVERRTSQAERDAALSERDAALSERDAALSERDAALSERDAALSERDAALAERDDVLMDRDSAFAKCKAVLLERDEAQIVRGVALSERDAALSERDAALSERDAALSERDAAMSERKSVLVERDAALTECAMVVKERNTTLRERDAALAERDVAARECAAALEQYDKAQVELEVIRRSRIWRSTAPLRKTLDWIKSCSVRKE